MSSWGKILVGQILCLDSVLKLGMKLEELDLLLLDMLLQFLSPMTYLLCLHMPLFMLRLQRCLKGKLPISPLQSALPQSYVEIEVLTEITKAYILVRACSSLEHIGHTSLLA